MMDAKLFRNTLSDSVRLHIGKDMHSTAVNESYRIIKELLRENGISILRTIRVGKLTEIDGYVIEVDGDGYSVLIENADDGDI